MTPDQIREGVARMSDGDRAEWLGKAFRETAEQQGAMYGLPPQAMAGGLLAGFASYALAHLPADGIEAGLLDCLGKVRARIAAGNGTRN